MYIFILNPKSGNAKALSKWSKLKPFLDDHQLSYELHVCKNNEETRKYMNEMIHRCHITAFVVIGGDGTISSVIQQLSYTDIPLAVLPAGSGNDVSRNFNLVSDVHIFAHKLLENEKITIDLLQVNGLYGVTVAGLGLDAMIGKRTDESFYKRLLNRINCGSFAYTIAAVIELLQFKPFHGKLTIDGKMLLHSELWLIASGNVKMYGGGMPICPSADPQDGWIQVTTLHNARRLKVLTRLFPVLLQGKHIFQDEVLYAKGKEITIQTDRPVPLVIDGEIFHTDSVVISMKQKALQLIKTSK